MGLRQVLKLIDPEVAPTLTPLGAPEPAEPIKLLRPITLIGDREDAHIRVTTPGVGTLHAALIVDGGGVWARDLASRSGTFVNDQRIRECRLQNNDTLRIGEMIFRLRCTADASELPNPSVVLETDGQRVACQGRVFTIGRRQGSDLELTHNRISLTHALVCAIGRRRFLCDTGTRTGTFLNKVRVHQIELVPGDLIHIGGIPIRALAPEVVDEPAAERIVLKAEESTKVEAVEPSSVAKSIPQDSPGQFPSPSWLGFDMPEPQAASISSAPDPEMDLPPIVDAAPSNRAETDSLPQVEMVAVQPPPPNVDPTSAPNVNPTTPPSIAAPPAGESVDASAIQEHEFESAPAELSEVESEQVQRASQHQEDLAETLEEKDETFDLPHGGSRSPEIPAELLGDPEPLPLFFPADQKNTSPAPRKRWFRHSRRN